MPFLPGSIVLPNPPLLAGYLCHMILQKTKKEGIASVNSREWFQQTADMSLDEKGVLFDLLCYQHLRGSLPDETMRLARLAKISEASFLPIWEVIKHSFPNAGMVKRSEVWTDIVGYEGIYMISNHGKITRNGKIVKPLNQTKGYHFVKLSKNCVVKSCLVHRLVAQHFIPNVFQKPMVNHKDENKKNNHFSNLEWCTSKENTEKFWNNIKLLKKSA